VDDNPKLQLARRLRELREESWPGRKITQPQLARALGGVSVPLISSWESQTNPRIPPLERLDAYAALFATTRSFDDDPGHIIAPPDMSDDERLLMSELKQELRQRRSAAMRPGTGTAVSEPEAVNVVTNSLNSGPWRFRDGNDVTIVCPQWPADMLEKIPYTNIEEPDYIELLTYSELDTLFELYGHIRAANPSNQVNLRSADRLASDDYTSHLVTLGGVDWNEVTSSAVERLDLPVRQIADWDTEGGQYFEVDDGTDDPAQYRPILDNSSSPPLLVEDVALFARGVNPFNQKRTITICSGMYGRGTYGAVRALTDKRFRDRNAEHLRSKFAHSEAYCILTRVPIVNGQTMTPDWTNSAYTLFDWQG
jgi:transcriptional regulator with XRE-family HTH domain